MAFFRTGQFGGRMFAGQFFGGVPVVPPTPPPSSAGQTTANLLLRQVMIDWRMPSQDARVHVKTLVLRNAKVRPKVLRIGKIKISRNAIVKVGRLFAGRHATMKPKTLYFGKWLDQAMAEDESLIVHGNIALAEPRWLLDQ